MDNTLSGPVDVLAVLDAQCDAAAKAWNEHETCDAESERLEDVMLDAQYTRAAVAELIKRAEYLCRTGEGMIMFRAALANIGGAK